MSDLTAKCGGCRTSAQKEALFAEMVARVARSMEETRVKNIAERNNDDAAAPAPEQQRQSSQRHKAQ